MSICVFLAVLCAALLHASWNALVKVSADRLVLLAVLKVTTTLVAVASIPFITIPPIEAWPYLAASVVIHTAYFLFLTIAYRFGDLSQVYPLSRGAAPLIVAGLAVFILGETLGQQAYVSLLLISLGIMSLIFSEKGAIGQPKAVMAALATACFIAGYTVADGAGARLSADAHSYILWLNVFNGIPIILIAAVLRRRQLVPQVKRVWKMGALSAIVSLAAYWIVLWASTQAPLALVAAVREASMVFAVFFGVVFLKEKLNLRKVLSVFVTLTGTALLRVSK
ncbi:DMT family transporter [Leisingera daeponensis]|uniref:DMT family transporter n=1 Tax=Leisingera daeponensis TaxID=405746 RepID=UPI001C94A531|nr:DMT family transporter [Leisingera daeponensis]MBY6059150.1 DMT family transporter [Leisingera daeponensis]